MNKKQLAYSRKKVHKALMQTKLRAFLILMLAFAIPATVSAFTHTDSAKESVSTVVTASMLSMAAIGNIESVNDKEVAGKALNYKVWLIHYNQIDHSVKWPSPVERAIETIPLKVGEKAHYFMAHDIPEYNASGQRGDLTMDSKNTFTMIMGGVTDKLQDFIEEFGGGKFILIFQECGKDEKYILGSACKPMILSNYNTNNNKENRSVTLTFENESIRQYYKYTGELAEAEEAQDASAQTTTQSTQSTPKAPDSPTAGK